MDPIPAFSKSAATGLSITAVCKNAGKKTPGQDDFFVVRRRRNGKVMVLFLGNVDFEVVDDVGIGFEKKEIVGLGFHELRVEMLLMIGGQIKECELHWLGEVGLAMVVKDE